MSPPAKNAAASLRILLPIPPATPTSSTLRPWDRSAARTYLLTTIDLASGVTGVPPVSDRSSKGAVVPFIVEVRAFIRWRSQRTWHGRTKSTAVRSTARYWTCVETRMDPAERTGRSRRYGGASDSPEVVAVNDDTAAALVRDIDDGCADSVSGELVSTDGSAQDMADANSSVALRRRVLIARHFKVAAGNVFSPLRVHDV